MVRGFFFIKLVMPTMMKYFLSAATAPEVDSVVF